MKITTRNGYTFTIDDEDYPIIKNYSWYGWKRPRRYVTYVVCVAKTGKHLYLHRLILNAPNGKQVDHIDGDGMNNCKSNLRLCNTFGNIRNRGKHRDNKSGFKGVVFNEKMKNRKWLAYICVNRQKIYIGAFTTSVQAARAYNNAALRFFGEFAWLNEVS